MKKLLMVFGIIFLMNSCSAGKAMQFERGPLQIALDKAKKENKPVFVDFYTTWCGPCKMMEKTVFTKSNVSKFYNKNFINIKIDAEKGEGRNLAAKYNVAGFPCLIYLDGNGKVIHKELGYINANMMVELGKKVAN
ncbi:MAG: thioredoxin family protein [Chitinophagales bacterium]